MSGEPPAARSSGIAFPAGCHPLEERTVVSAARLPDVLERLGELAGALLVVQQQRGTGLGHPLGHAVAGRGPGTNATVAGPASTSGTTHRPPPVWADVGSRLDAAVEARGAPSMAYATARTRLVAEYAGAYPRSAAAEGER